MMFSPASNRKAITSVNARLRRLSGAKMRRKNQLFWQMSNKHTESKTKQKNKRTDTKIQDKNHKKREEMKMCSERKGKEKYKQTETGKRRGERRVRGRRKKKIMEMRMESMNDSPQKVSKWPRRECSGAMTRRID